MPLSATQLQNLVQGQLTRVSDPQRRARLPTFLTPPQLRSFAWDYGATDERHEVWVVGETPDHELALVYSDIGFGPQDPWGFIFPADDSLGMDSQWHSGLEDAAIGAGLLEAPPGYVVR